MKKYGKLVERVSSTKQVRIYNVHALSTIASATIKCKIE